MWHAWRSHVGRAFRRGSRRSRARSKGRERQSVNDEHSRPVPVPPSGFVTTTSRGPRVAFLLILLRRSISVGETIVSEHVFDRSEADILHRGGEMIRRAGQEGEDDQLHLFIGQFERSIEHGHQTPKLSVPIGKMERDVMARLFAKLHIRKGLFDSTRCGNRCISLLAHTRCERPPVEA